MKPIQIFLLLVVAALAGAGGWFAAKKSGKSGATTTDNGTIYTCSMHPQVRQNKPGTCPFCGMALAPLSQVGRSNLPPGAVMLSSNRINAINVQTVEARRQPLRRTLRVAGMIDDNEARHRILSAYVEGRIDKLLVNFSGAEVKEGQPLATIYSPMLLATEREYVALLKRKPAGDVASLHETHEQLLNGARQRLRRLGLSEKQIAALPDKPADAIHTEILAPLGGTVVSRMAYEGLYVKEGEKLFEIADFATMWFRFDAYERDLAWLKPGQAVEVTTPSVPGKTYTAPITFIDPNLNDPTRSAKVRVEIQNPLIETNGVQRRELLHRLYAQGVVKVDAPDVLAIPRSAVLAPGRPYVFVDKGDGVYEPRHLKLGRAGDELWEVLEGLQEGERVVTTGNLLIDAQAQLDSGGGPSHEHDGATPSPATPASLPPLTDAQRAASTNFLAFADAITSSLAADDLAKFNELAGKSHGAVATLAGAFEQDSPWRSLVGRVEASAHIASAKDLKAARKNFHPLSEATVAFAKALRRQEAAFQSVKVFRCPMSKDAFAGAPRTAEWLQLQPQIRNPYFGAEMIDCGSEVKQ